MDVNKYSIDFSETEIVGNWIYDGIRVVEDENSKKISWLIDNYLNKISADQTGWDVLYQDPQDLRYWELNYRHGERHGGGPPSLLQLPKECATSKYSL
jgi:hypothetical protein